MSAKGYATVVLALLAKLSLASPYPYLYRSAHLKGRGDAGIASASGVEAIFYNPAGLATSGDILEKIVIVSPEVELSNDTKDFAHELSFQDEDPTESFRSRLGKPQHLGISNFSGVILKRAAVGVFVHSDTTAMMYRDHSSGASEAISAAAHLDIGLVYSLAELFFDKTLQLGLTGKYIARNQGAITANSAEANKLKQLKGEDVAGQGRGSGIDLGLIYRPKSKVPLMFGLTLQDIGNTRFKSTGGKSSSDGQSPLKTLKQTLNLGFALEPSAHISTFGIYLDLRDVLGANTHGWAKRVHLGSEIAVLDNYGLTAGLNQGYPSAGLFVQLPFLRCDIGIYTEELGDKAGSRPDTRLFIKLEFGI